MKNAQNPVPVVIVPDAFAEKGQNYLLNQNYYTCLKRIMQAFCALFYEKLER
jgi:hypothetical protein